MREYLNIGCTPADEECFQVGRDDPLTLRLEANEFCECLKAYYRPTFGDGVDDVFKVKSFAHDFGTYYEVVAWYYAGDEDTTNLAYDAEGCPGRWSEYSRQPDWSKLAAKKFSNA